MMELKLSNVAAVSRDFLAKPANESASESASTAVVSEW